MLRHFVETNAHMFDWSAATVQRWTEWAPVRDSTIIKRDNRQLFALFDYYLSIHTCRSWHCDFWHCHIEPFRWCVRSVVFTSGSRFEATATQIRLSLFALQATINAANRPSSSWMTKIFNALPTIAHIFTPVFGFRQIYKTFVFGGGFGKFVTKQCELRMRYCRFCHTHTHTHRFPTT